MKIHYDRSTPIVMLGMTPFYRLGPERWFDDYTIISYLPWDVSAENVPRVFPLRDYNPGIVLSAENTQALVNTNEFAVIAKENGLTDATFLTYRPVSMPFGNAVDDDGKRFTKTYENKSWFRKNYAKKLRVPKYKSYKLRDISDETYDEVSRILGAKLVVQHEKLSGGRGTFFAQDKQSFSAVISELLGKKKVKDFHKIIISEAVSNPEEISVQACITRFGTLVGPTQQQIVRNPDLVNPNSPSADQFCGGKISSNLVDADTRRKIIEMTETVATDMKTEGYSGIFGVDFLKDDTGELYAIEVNARMTGMLPLLTQMQEEYPFLLLHILEKIGADYTIEDVDLSEPEKVSDGAYLVVHDLGGGERVAESPLASGQYSLSGEFLSGELIAPVDGVAVHSYMQAGSTIDADRRIGALFMRSGVDVHDPLGGIPRQLLLDFHASTGYKG